MIAQVISTVLHLMLCVFWVVPSGMDVYGLGMATMITYLVMWLLTELYGLCIAETRRAM